MTSEDFRNHRRLGLWFAGGSGYAQDARQARYLAPTELTILKDNFGATPADIRKKIEKL